MAAKCDAKSVLAPAAILFIICVAVAAALAGTNALTKERIAQAALAKAEESRMVVLPGAESFEEAADGSHYIGKAGGDTVGYVFETESKGYGGTVKVMTGIRAEGEITGVVILSHSETPGLGANAEKEDFREQFKQPVANSTGIQVVKFQAPAEGEIQAMTGATITSTAVTNAVNSAIEMYQDAYASEGGN